VAGDPNVPNGEVATVEHAAPLLTFGMAIVPVTPLGTGLTPGNVPGTGKPFGPTGAPGAVPSEEVTPSGGMTVPTWANAGLQQIKGQAATINNGRMDGDGLMEISLIRAEGLRCERPQAPRSLRDRKR
jgi:hypothetical protein